MYLKLRIVFTVLAALCLAVALPIGTFFGLGWAGLCGFSALLFFGLMLLCKQSQEFQAQKQQPKTPDFFSAKTDKTEKNP